MRQLDVFDTIIFDLDGTLLNTLEDLHSSTNYALVQMGFPGRSVDEVRRFVGNGVANLIKRAVPAGTDEEVTKQCLEVFTEHYNVHMEDYTAPYPGIVDLLTKLKEWGIKTAVVSNKYDGAVRHLCCKYFNGLIDVTVGEQEGLEKKPAPDCVLAALEKLGSKIEHTLYVGDSDVDMETAKNTGVVSVGVTWGFRDEALLRATGANYLTGKPDVIQSFFVSQNAGIQKEED